MLALVCNVGRSLECHKRLDGSFEFRENDEVVVPKPFDCLSVMKSVPSSVMATYMSTDNDGRNVCQINDDGVPKDKKIYSPSEVETGQLCQYKCKDATGLYRCEVPSKPTDNACTCVPRQHSVIIQAIVGTELGGQNEEIEEEKSCAGKPEGYQFPDPVPCISLRAEVTKRRVDFIDQEQRLCKVETGLKPETRYIQASRDDLNLQGCFNVCKRAGPRCISEEVDGRCECASPGLAARLVSMTDTSMRDVINQKNCASDGCGRCGVCNKETKKCMPRSLSREGDFCPCGEICPEEEERHPDLRGGKILCIPNAGLECVRKTGLFDKMFNQPEPGTKKPNLCTPGKSDRADTCSCAPGYHVIPGPFSAMYCTNKVLAPKDGDKLELAAEPVLKQLDTHDLM